MTVKKAPAKVAVVETKPKRFEVGYKFPIMATIVGIDSSEDDDYYVVEVDSDITEDNYYDKERFIALESVCNPKAKKDCVAEQLKAAQEVVKKLTKQLESL